MNDKRDRDALLEDVLAQNPQIDPEELEAAREMLRRLRAQGVRRKAYDLAPAFGGQRAIVHDDPGDDTRLVSTPRPTDPGVTE
jgi:hypothetical protein